MAINVIGLSAFYHESSCCLLQGGELVAAASEERFTRVKHDPRLPVEAFRFCLEAGGLSISDVDAVAYYESAGAKLSRQLWAGVPRRASAPFARLWRDGTGTPEAPWLDPGRPQRAIRERLGFDGRILSFPHHLSHAASSYFFSGFTDAAVLTVDGVGEWATMTYGRGRGGELELFEEVAFPHSLGLLYSTLTCYLGFEVLSGEYKVMGLAAYGEPRYVDQICRLVAVGDGGQVRLNLEYFDFIDGEKMYSPALERLFGAPARTPGAEIEPCHRDVACSLQLVLEEILLEKAAYLHRRTGTADLCLAGGVALNCVANGRLRREGPFERLFVQPAAGDAGGCLGAAALGHRQITGAPRKPGLRPGFLGPAPPGPSAAEYPENRHAQQTPSGPPPPARRLGHAGFGPSYQAAEIAALLEATGIAYQDFRGLEDELTDAVAGRLAGGEIAGWFHGAMEFGPRALGARSILADPRDAAASERLNRRIKRREDFRPFAPSVLAERAPELFELDHHSPFMLETCQVKTRDLPAVTHVDGSARPQTVDAETSPRFARLLAAFERRTGCPVLLNTSFNVAGEPIVCAPADALFTMAAAGLDLLVLEDFLIDRQALPASWPALFTAWDRAARDPFAAAAGVVGERLYTFV